jgi:hypothetical protein
LQDCRIAGLHTQTEARRGKAREDFASYVLCGGERGERYICAKFI